MADREKTGEVGMKDLIRKIVRTKYQADKDSILFINPDLFNECKSRAL